MHIMIDSFYFALGMFLGMLILYIYAHNPMITLKHQPTPQDCGQITYSDNSGVCYKYKKKMIKN